MGKKELTRIGATSALNSSNPERRLQTIEVMTKILMIKFPQLDLFDAVNYAYEILELVEKELYE